MKINELLQLRMKAVTDSRSILDKVEAEKRGLSADEKEQYEKFDGEINRLTFQIDEQRKLDTIAGVTEEIRSIKPEFQKSEKASNDLRDTDEYRNAFTGFLKGEKRAAMTTLVAADGGVLVPTTLFNKISTILLDKNVMRQLATVVKCSGPFNMAQMTGYGTANWAGESNAYATLSQTFASPILNFNPHKLTALETISEELIQDSAFDVEGFVVNAIATLLAQAEESAFISGNGIGKPTGLVVEITNTTTSASNNVATATFDDLLDLEAKVKPIYHSSASFLMNDATAKGYRKMKDTLGRYLWTPSVDVATPDKLWNYPVYRAWAMPNFTAGLRPVIFGDISQYVIAVRSDMVVQRLVERYAELGEVGFRAFIREDGHLKNTEAVAALVVKA